MGSDKQNYQKDGKCTADYQTEDNCKYFCPGITNGGSCLMRFNNGDCLSFEALEIKKGN